MCGGGYCLPEFPVSISTYRNEILKIVIKLNKLVQNIHKMFFIKPRIEKNGFHRFWITLYIVYEFVRITQFLELKAIAG